MCEANSTKNKTMTTDIVIVNPDSVEVKPSGNGSHPRIMFSPDVRILLKSWSQLEELRDNINTALNEFYNSEVREVVA